MKSKSTNAATFFAPLAIAVFASFAAINACAQDRPTASAEGVINVNDSTCFPMCKSAAPTNIEIETDANTPKVINPLPCGNASADIIKQAEQLGDRIKPIKDMVGYIRSPQGLAIKLVNDHVVKIPAWIGYAIDPVGSLKNRVMDEARTAVTVRVKAAIGPSRTDAACNVVPNIDGPNVVEPRITDVYVPIDSAALPLDTNQI